MSADNGIYIVKFPDGFRVAYAQAIEIIDYYLEGSDERKEKLKMYFGNSKVYVEKELAILAAHSLAEQYEYLDYGVRLMPGEFEAFE
ncbi:MAG: hypothetical protein ACD_33C00023G0002 [uncultured bacterium]|nr:MAG: hypothetical protein ACD_33C00023G0002 [uncultured bacterium]